MSDQDLSPEGKAKVTAGSPFVGFTQIIFGRLDANQTVKTVSLFLGQLKIQPPQLL